jgi:hypothetical protein
VQIKPSGWGTRVTLTVTRELPPAEPTSPSAGEQTHAAALGAAGRPEPEEGSTAGAPEASGGAAADSASEAASTSEADGVPEADGSPETGGGTPVAEASGPAAWPAAEEPAEAVEGHLAWPVANEPEFEPQTPAAAWAKRDWAHEAEIDSEDPISDPGDEAPLEAGRFDWLAYEAEDPHPRRGFFARLFGRRKPLPPEPELVDAEASKEDAAEEVEDLAAGEPPLESGEAPEEVESFAVMEAPETPLAPDTPENALAPDTPENALAPDSAVAPDASDAPETAAAAVQPADISAELITAEEDARAEVTAVLTSVLDRLGAAHHRPFSRG